MAGDLGPRRRPKQMGQITSLFVRKVVAAVDDGADKDALLRSVGIDPSEPVDPSRMVSDSEYYELFERCAVADSAGTTLPLRVGATMRCQDYGAFGLAWKSAPDLRGSFARAERYARILTSVATYATEPTAEGAFLHLNRDGERRLGMRLSNEATIASIVSISREASSRELRPVAVFFKHPPPGSTAAHESHFGCPVHFAAARDALLVSEDTLQTPNKVGDAGIAEFFDTRLAADLANLGAESSLERRVRDRISRSLSEGAPTVSRVAADLHMSGRTLQRRLAERETSFQALLDESRRQLAERLLRETDYSLAEVAFMTGFAEQSSLTRAFKRWAGQTPRSYRLRPLGR